MRRSQLRGWLFLNLADPHHLQDIWSVTSARELADQIDAVQPDRRRRPREADADADAGADADERRRAVPGEL